MAISLELGLILAAVVVGVVTPLLPIWAWIAGSAVFFVLIPLGLYSRECVEWFKQRTSQPAGEDPGATQAQDDLAAFKACLPHVERCCELIEPFAGPKSTVEDNIRELQALDAAGNDLLELNMRLGYLNGQLEALGIQCPILPLSDERPDLSVHVRLKLWSIWLMQLKVMIDQGDLKSARLVPPAGTSTQLALDK